MENLNKLALRNFQQYLQIPTVHPNVDYAKCVKFLENQAEELQLPIQVIYLKPKKPVVIITWVGVQDELPSVFLNSHMDVVPVFEEQWKYKPFGAEVHEGKIYARGSQDMKSVGIQYLEAIRRLKLNGVICSRTVHVCFVPEEEIGGEEGMKLFTKTEEFKKLNIGIALDESITSENDAMILFYGEKCLWQFDIYCEGQTGHGSLLLDNTPGEKVAYLLQKFYDFRKDQEKNLRENHNSLGDVTTINCTKISGGVQDNVIPNKMLLTFDCRISTKSITLKDFECMINSWIKEAGPHCSISYHAKESGTPNTELNDSNIFWTAFKKATDKMKIEIKTELNCATSDSRYLREMGIPSFGFSPINNTKKLLHSHNEYLGVDTFLKGIEIYCEIIKEIANA